MNQPDDGGRRGGVPPATSWNRFHAYGGAPRRKIMKQYFNERTLQVLLCIVLIGIAILTWHWTHSAFLCMAACVGFTAIWIAVGFWKTRSSDKNTGT